MATVIVLCAIALSLADGDAGRESPFVLGAGGRGMGMGRAFVSLSGDPSATFWNPAATGLLERSEFMAFHTSLFMSTNYDCLALSHPIGSLGVFSMSAGRLGTDGIEERDLNNLLIKTVSSSEFQFGISYARPIYNGIVGGLTFKDAMVEIGDNAGSGVGLDLGLQYRPTMISGLSLGASLNDLIQPRVKLVNTDDKLQTTTRMGVSFSRSLSAKFTPTAALEIDKTQGRSSQFRAGLEAAFRGSYSVRLGFDKDRPTFGAGIMYGIFKLDYAYENIQYFGASHRISLGMAFGKSVKKSEEEAQAKIIGAAQTDWQNSLVTQRKMEFNSYMAKGDSLRGTNRYQDAIAYYQRALGINDTSAIATKMSDSLMTLIIADAASHASDSKREKFVTDRTQAGVEAFKAGHYNDAISQYNLALEIDPGNTTVANLLASAKDARQTQIDHTRDNARKYRDSGDYSNAITEWNNLLIQDPSDAEAKQGIDISRNQLKADALIMSAISSMKTEKYAQAVIYLQQAQSFRPDDESIKSLLSEARAKSAPATTLETIKASPDYWAIYLKGLAAYQAGDYSTALKNWESLRDYYPNNADLEKNINQARQRLSTEGKKP